MLLFPSLASVADLHSAHTDDDGHDEEEDTSNQTGCDRPSLHVLRHGISEDKMVSLYKMIPCLRGQNLLKNLVTNKKFEKFREFPCC